MLEHISTDFNIGDKLLLQTTVGKRWVVPLQKGSLGWWNPTCNRTLPLDLCLCCALGTIRGCCRTIVVSASGLVSVSAPCVCQQTASVRLTGDLADRQAFGTKARWRLPSDGLSVASLGDMLDLRFAYWQWVDSSAATVQCSLICQGHVGGVVVVVVL